MDLLTICGLVCIAIGIGNKLGWIPTGFIFLFTYILVKLV